MADGVPRERRATPCRDYGSDHRPADPTVDLPKNIARGCDFSHGCASIQQVDDDVNTRASQEQYYS